MLLKNNLLKHLLTVIQTNCKYLTKYALICIFFLFSYASAQVTSSIGKDGWLFLDEEQPLRSQEVDSDIDTSLRIINNVNKFLKFNNIKLLIAPIPIKARVYSEYLTSNLSPSAKSRYTRSLNYFDEAGIPYTDIYTAMIKAKKTSPGKNLFFKLGSHWNSWGSEVSARAVARKLLETNFLKNIGTVSVSIQRLGERDSDDSMFNMLKNSGSFDKYTEIDMPSKTLFHRDSSLLDDATPDIILLGTSYSEQTWNFPGFLSFYTKRDLLDFSLSGQQIWIPLERYLKSESFANHKPKLIIWEIPERYLLYPPLGYRSMDTSWIKDILKTK